MMTEAAMTTVPTTAPLQMQNKIALAPTTVTLQTAACCKCNDFQAMHTHNCTQCVYANACTAVTTVHNVKLLSEDRENFED